MSNVPRRSLRIRAVNVPVDKPKRKLSGVAESDKNGGESTVENDGENEEARTVESHKTSSDKGKRESRQSKITVGEADLVELEHGDKTNAVEEEVMEKRVTRRSSRLETIKGGEEKADPIPKKKAKKKEEKREEEDRGIGSKKRRRNDPMNGEEENVLEKEEKVKVEDDEMEGKDEEAEESVEVDPIPKKRAKKKDKKVEKEEGKDEEDEKEDDMKGMTERKKLERRGKGTPKRKEKGNIEEEQNEMEEVTEESDVKMESRDYSPSPPPPSRPRRSCAVNRKFVEVKKEEEGDFSSSSSSLVDSSESLFEDSELDTRKKKTANKLKKKVKQESTEDEGDSDDEEDELMERVKREREKKERPRKKREGEKKGRKREKSERRDTKRQPTSAGTTRKMSNVVKTEPKGHYDVDEEEMVAWEAKALVMKKRLKILERDTANTGEKMERVNAFVNKMLAGRKWEMTEAESVRAIRLLEKEFDEAARQGKLSVAQRLKESMEKKKEEESDEEDEWEEMETVDDAVDKSMNVYAEHPVSKGEADWKSKWLRAEVNRTMRQRQEAAQKVHLLCFISHLLHLKWLATSPHSLVSTAVFSLLGDERGTDLIEWFNIRCKRTKDERKWKNDEERLLHALKTGEVSTDKDEATLLFSFLRAAGMTTRLVMRCNVMSKKVPINENVKKGKEKKTTKARKRGEKRDGEEKRGREEEMYWVEWWDKETMEWKAASGDVESRVTSVKGKEGPVLYFLAIDNERGIRDVSARFIDPPDFVSRDYRTRRVDGEWWEDTLMVQEWKENERRARIESKEWDEMLRKQPYPTTVAAFKDHPLYVLDKDVLKLQMIFPYDTPPLGEVKGHKFFSRQRVHPINTENWYLKMGRQIKEGEEPCREKLDTNPFTKEKYLVSLYGYWQTEPYDPGEVEDGRIPRNDFDNVYLYQPSMCPRGGIHLTPPGLMRVAQELELECVPAVIGWHFKGGNTIPIMKGAVYVKEDVPRLVKEWVKYEKRWRREEKENRAEAALVNWKKLVRGAIRLETMRKRFAPANEKEQREELEESVQREVAQSWPQRRYGGDMFEF